MISQYKLIVKCFWASILLPSLVLLTKQSISKIKRIIDNGLYEAFSSKETSDQSDRIYFLSGSQVFNAADAKANVPVTIETDPNVVNLYFVILNRDKKHVVIPELPKIRNASFGPIKKLKHKPLKQSTHQPKKQRKRPMFTYHASANRRPKSNHQVHKQVKPATKKPKRAKRMCKRRGKKPIPCSTIRITAFEKAKLKMRERELLYKKKRIIPNVCLRINVNRCGIQACNLGGLGEM